MFPFVVCSVVVSISLAPDCDVMLSRTLDKLSTVEITVARVHFVATSSVYVRDVNMCLVLGLSKEHQHTTEQERDTLALYFYNETEKSASRATTSMFLNMFVPPLSCMYTILTSSMVHNYGDLRQTCMVSASRNTSCVFH